MCSLYSCDGVLCAGSSMWIARDRGATALDAGADRVLSDGIRILQSPSTHQSLYSD